MIDYLSKKQILRKGCLVNILQRLNGKGILVSETGEKEEINPIRELEFYSYVSDKNHSEYIALADYGVAEEMANDIKIKVDTIEEIELIDIEEYDGNIVSIYIVVRFLSGNESHIVNAA